MDSKQAKAMYRVSDIAGMILGCIGTAMLCVGEPIGLAVMGVAGVLLMAAVGLYGKAHPETEESKDRYYNIRSQAK